MVGPGARFFSVQLQYSQLTPGLYALTNQTINEDNTTQRFDLSDQVLLPRNTTLWLALFAPLALSRSGKGQNAVYWRTATGIASTTAQFSLSRCAESAKVEPHTVD